jgi:hypothetical protein
MTTPNTPPSSAPTTSGDRKSQPRMHGDELHVLVVDDSAMVRQVMHAILSTNPMLKVNVAADPLIAWGKMQKDPPVAPSSHFAPSKKAQSRSSPSPKSACGTSCTNRL